MGIWIGHQLEPTWEEFREEVNNFSILGWEFEEPSKRVFIFLNLTISIENETIVTKTYQKDIILYQYLSPMSNSPLSMIKGIIYSLLKTYKKTKYPLRRLPGHCDKVIQSPRCQRLKQNCAQTHGFGKQ